MNARDFLNRELGSDLSSALGIKVCSLLDKYLKENEMKNVKTVKVIKAPAGHWYEKKVGTSFNIIEYSEMHDAYLVEVKGYATGRLIYERDCEVTTWNKSKDAEEFMTLELEKESYDFVNPSHYKKFEKETYEMMIDIWGVDAYIKHCEMCAFKYKLRAGEKPDQPVERDLEKAEWYLEMANKFKL